MSRQSRFSAMMAQVGKDVSPRRNCPHTVTSSPSSSVGEPDGAGSPATKKRKLAVENIPIILPSNALETIQEDRVDRGESSEAPVVGSVLGSVEEVGVVRIALEVELIDLDEDNTEAPSQEISGGVNVSEAPLERRDESATPPLEEDSDFLVDKGSGVSLLFNEEGEMVGVNFTAEDSILPDEQRFRTSGEAEAQQPVVFESVPSGMVTPRADVRGVSTGLTREIIPLSIVTPPHQLESAVASSSVTDYVLNAELEKKVENILMAKLTNKWSLDSYVKRIEGSITKSVKTSNAQLEMATEIETLKAVVEKLEKVNKEMQGQLVDLDEGILHVDLKTNTNSDRVKELSDEYVKLFDDHEVTKKDLVLLTEEFDKYKKEQGVLISCLNARASSLEELRRMDNVSRGTENISEINTHRMEGFQRCALLLATKGKLPRSVMNDRSFTDLLLDKNGVLLALSEQEIQSYRHQESPRFVADQRCPARDPPSSSQHAPDGRRGSEPRKDPTGGRPK